MLKLTSTNFINSFTSFLYILNINYILLLIIVDFSQISTIHSQSSIMKESQLCNSIMSSIC